MSYVIESDEGRYWINAPGIVDPSLPPPDVIACCQEGGLGAAFFYRDKFGARIWLHRDELALLPSPSESPDRAFNGDVEEGALRGCHVGGRHPGFTVYYARGHLFVCDLILVNGSRFRVNSRGPQIESAEAVIALSHIVERYRPLRTCGWNYVMDSGIWAERLNDLLTQPPRMQSRDNQSPIHVCGECGLTYDPVDDAETAGISPGLAFADFPADWHCPDCGAEPARFERLG